MDPYTPAHDACILCGKCLPVCTIFQIHQDETTSPRGFLALVGAHAKGTLPLDEESKKIFESCFLCTNCVTACPKSLPTDVEIERIRAQMARRFGIRWYKRAFFGLLKSRPWMDLAMRLASLGSPLLFQGSVREGKMTSRLPFKHPHLARAIPPTASRSFLQSVPERTSWGGTRTVALFIGCMANYNYTEVGHSLLRILRFLGIRVLVPKAQLCCGAPSYFTGDTETTDWLIKHNIALFEGFLDEVEAILIPEATCSAMMKVDWAHHLHSQPDWKARAEWVTTKVHLATEWLYHHTDLSEKMQTLPVRSAPLPRVTYHDPCHAAKVQGVRKEPRALLRGGRYSLVEMSDPDRCCGFGGVTLQSDRYELSQAAGRPKAEMIQKTGADVVSAECSACRIQLTNALHLAHSTTRFAHPLELLAEVIGEGPWCEASGGEVRIP